MRAPLVNRLALALPDAVSAALFLLLWIAPARLGPGALATGMLVMLVEFVLIHATGMLGNMLLGGRSVPIARLAALLGFGGIYLIFILAFSFAFEQWWPVMALLWLLLGKAMFVFGRRLPDGDHLHRLQSGWAVACIAYVLGVMLTLLLPLPRLGITPAIVSAADLPGSGHWVEHPHSVVAFGFLYFTTLAAVKFRDLRLPKLTPAA